MLLRTVSNEKFFMLPLCIIKTDWTHEVCNTGERKRIFEENRECERMFKGTKYGYNNNYISRDDEECFFITSRNKSKKGMSLAEILVAICLVSTVIVIIIGTMIAGLEAVQKGTGYNQATIIARRNIEVYKSMKYSSIPVNPDIIKQEPGFTVKTGITENTYPLSGTIKYKKITVNVSNSSSTGAKSVNVKMIIYLFPDLEK